MMFATDSITQRQTPAIICRPGAAFAVARVGVLSRRAYRNSRWLSGLCCALAIGILGITNSGWAGLWVPQDEATVNDSYQKEEARLAGLTVEELRAEFNQWVTEWKRQHSRLIQGHMQFHMVKEVDSEVWAIQFRDAKKKGEQARKAASHVAVVLLEKMPENPDKDLVDMVYKSLDAHLVFQQYGQAYRAARALVESGQQRPYLLGMYAYSAFCLNQFEEARSLFSQAIIIKESLSDVQKAASEMCGTALFRSETEKLALEADAEANLPRVEIMTTKGPMVVELFEDQAPNAVASFIFLVERNFYRNQQFYDVSESLAFTGSPTNEPSGNAGYGIRSEFDRPDRRPHWRGYLTLLVNPDTQVGSSQFAIMMKPRPDLDTAENTVFGRIIEGEEVLDLLEKAGKTWQDMITAADSQIGPPDQILSARVLRKRDHEYVPTRVGE